MVTGDALADRKLTLKDKLAWAVGQIGESVKSSVFSAFILFYYNQILGVSATMTGLAMMIAVLTDAMSDPIIGSISDRFHSRWGRRHPFMFVAAVPMSIFIVLIFVPPEGLSETGLFVWLAVCAILVNFFQTLYHIPHLALAAEMSRDYMDRTSLFSFGSLFGWVTGTVFYFTMLTIFFPTMPDGQNGLYNAAGYPAMAISGAIIASIAIFWCVWGTRKQIPFLISTQPVLGEAAVEHTAQVSERPVTAALREAMATLRTVKFLFPSPSMLLSDLRVAFLSKSYRSIFVGLLCSTIVLAIEGTFGAYMGVHFWGLPTEHLRWPGIGMLLALPIGTMISPMVNRILDKKLSLILPSIVAILNGNVLIVLRLTGYFPENGDPIILPLLILSSFIAGLVIPVIFITLDSMFADIADELELATGKRQEGIIYSARAFAVKTARSLGLLLGGVAIDLIAFPRQSPPGTVDPDVIFRLGLVQGPGTSIFVMAALILYTRYGLDRHKHADIRRQLAERASAAEGGDP